ncbi:MAG: C69 family dipeptidase [Treponema sp.]|nr:C69 family dipeptidase [Treponema sp.]
MCDTFSLPFGYNEDNVTYFAKNSDRSPNEPHVVIHVPRKNHPQGSTVSCTYITIPQAENTHEAILLKPSWMWGAEMGVNDAQVAIGNEAVFTRTKRGGPALTGMDLLRLALERADTAQAAVETMITLLETHGQGGNCGFDHPFFYDNSFMVADPKEVYIMETSGKNYAVVRAQGQCAISNRLTITTEHQHRSGIEERADFSKRYTEPVYSFFSAARERRQQVMDRLSPSLKTADLFGILRSHEQNVNGREFTRGSVKSVCMHGGGLIGDHTTGSLVAVLRQNKPPTLWCTGASTPCISAFKPVFFGSDAPPVFTSPEQSKDYWLQRERLNRAAIAGFVNPAVLRERIKTLEANWLIREQTIMNDDVPNANGMQTLSREASTQEQALVDKFSAPNWNNLTGRGSYGKYWRKKNAVLG